jgi:hypothetical protein
MSNDAMDPELKARLYGIKLVALVREHFGDIEPTDQIGLSVGAAMTANDASWVLIEDKPERGLGVALAWASRHGVRDLHVLASAETTTLARRSAGFDLSITVWHVDGISMSQVSGEPAAREIDVTPGHDSFIGTITDSGADVIIEHGVVTGEVRGLEVCRVVTDGYTGMHRLEVGVGAHDREAFGMMHGDTPTTQSLKRIVDVVRKHRTPGADPHPLNRLGAERALRTLVIEQPELVGATALRAVASASPRPNLKDPIPCVALGEKADGQRVVTVFSTGIDLDVIPFAVDARLYHADPETELVVVVPKRDVSPVTTRLVEMMKHPARVVGI